MTSKLRAVAIFVVLSVQKISRGKFIIISVIVLNNKFHGGNM
jgi:hypothetical protein